ncbi:integrase [Neobacillus niacini]|nr:integrase [Neobacillus niacini]
MNNNSNARLKPWSYLLLVMHATGVRQGELLSLKWHDKDSARKNN